MEILRTENLSHIYSPKSPFEHRALDDVSLSIEAGTLTGIIGRTGSGKSTLISHFNGLLRPTSGKVFVDGEDIWNEPKKIRRIRFKVGLVFQFPEYQLFEDTVEKDIAFGPKNMGLSEDEVALRVREAADTVGLSAETLKKSPFELSGGQKRRVAIAGVIAMKPRLLILDEPAAGLDPRGRDEIFDHVRAYLASGDTAAVIVSHSMDDVARIADRIVVMEDGRIQLNGTPKEVFSNRAAIEDAGLRLPFVSRVMHMLRDRGFDADASVLDVESAAKAIMKLKGREV
ncbi:MAG: energy-coupling factor transporter ATPase [Clostridiales bacterium]|nr:energy-coupling factor transporter ATPase [Clostridiales bacterium]